MVPFVAPPTGTKCGGSDWVVVSHVRFLDPLESLVSVVQQWWLKTMKRQQTLESWDIWVFWTKRGIPISEIWWLDTSNINISNSLPLYGFRMHVSASSDPFCCRGLGAYNFACSQWFTKKMLMLGPTWSLPKSQQHHHVDSTWGILFSSFMNFTYHLDGQDTFRMSRPCFVFRCFS